MNMTCAIPHLSLLDKTPEPPQCDTTFTSFPKLPLEVRVMIWTFASSQPRNLDIWVRAGAKICVDSDINCGIIQHQIFAFHTKQPVPAVLQANSEARVVALQYYKLDFASAYDRVNCSDDILCLSTSCLPRIRRNFDADRICPMGLYGREAHTQIWCTDDSPPSFAVNIRESDHYPREFDFPTPLDDLIFSADGLREEILLYHCEESFSNPGMFDFKDVAERTCSPQEWKALSEAKDRLVKEFAELVVKEREISREHYEEELPEGFKLDWEDDMPVIRLVALLIDGIRQY